ncbi:MAG: ABC transporter ATP-binding protein [Sulfurospirillaceae bacterium]|nr:ABC transporter ATP-binding protein [Sulfurospirillaceae bacterium]
MLEIKNGSGGYDKTTIIRDININIQEGEKVALLGRNGVGKTTLLKFIMQQLNLYSGDVIMCGEKLGKSLTSRAKHGIGYVPQGRFVFERLSVRENIAAVAYANKYDADEAIESALSIFPILKEHLMRDAGSLSGGQQQIVAIARALAMKPKILLLDEPSEGIQPSIIDDIAVALNSLNKNMGMALIIAEQNFDFCMSIAERALIMDRGTIMKKATKEELHTDDQLLKELLAI